MFSLDWQPILSYPASGRKAFLQALSQREPDLADILRQAEIQLELVEFARTENGCFLARERAWDQETLLVPLDHLAERRDAQARALQKAVEEGARLVVLAGIGMGDICLEVLRLLSEHSNVGFLVVEHSPVRVLVAATLYDLSALAGSGNVLWVLGQNGPERISRLCRENYLYLIPSERRRFLLGAIPASHEEAERYTATVASLPAVLESELDRFEECVRRFLNRSREAPGVPGLVWSYHSPRAYIHLPLVQMLLAGFQQRGWRTRCELAGEDFVSSLRLAASVVRSVPDLYLFLNGPSRIFLTEAGISPAAERDIERPRVIWIVDDLFLSAPPDVRTGYSSRDYIFCIDRTYVDRFKHPGGGKVSFLPASTCLPGPGKFRPELADRICFVGSIEDMTQYLDRLSSRARSWVEHVTRTKEQRRRMLFREIVDAERPSSSVRNEVSQAAHAYLATTAKEIKNPQQVLDYFLYVACNFLYRLRIIRSLLSLGIRVFGPESWLGLLPSGYSDRYGGFISTNQAADVYASADISLNLHSFQCPTCLNPRDFDIIMAGGCLLADWVEDYDRGFFAAGSEVEFFRSEEELLEKADRLLSDPDRRECMKSGARRRLFSQHTPAHRVDFILQTLGFPGRTK